jgi:hypothetical protein
MVRAVSCLVFVYVSLVTSAVYSQSNNAKIERFSDLMTYLEMHTQFKFAYPKKLSDVTITVNEGVNLSDPKLLQQWLAPYGIEVIHRGDLLIFRRRSNATKKINGFVRDAESGESLVGANVIDLASGKGVASNTFGFFTLDTSGDSIAVSFVGYAYTKLSVKDAGDEFLMYITPIISLGFSLSSMPMLLIVLSSLKAGSPRGMVAGYPLS